MANFNQILNESLMTQGMRAQQVPKGKRYLLLLDIDDTLLTAKNIYIYRKLPTDEKEVILTPKQYAKENITSNNKKYYDYRDFRNEKKVLKSILTGIPLWRNLRVMDHHIANGWEIGILTARGMEDIIYKAMAKWLKYKPIPGKGKDISYFLKGYKRAKSLLKRTNVHAIGTASKGYEGATDFDKKTNVIKQKAKIYDMVKFLDDDQKNLTAVENLKLKNVIAVKALPKNVN